MNHESDDIPIAGRLSDPEFPQREATLLALFKSVVVATEEIPRRICFPRAGG